MHGTKLFVSAIKRIDLKISPLVYIKTENLINKPLVCLLCQDERFYSHTENQKPSLDFQSSPNKPSKENNKNETSKLVLRS